jgi:Flp pilus assembly protein TadD
MTRTVVRPGHHRSFCALSLSFAVLGITLAVACTGGRSQSTNSETGGQTPAPAAALKLASDAQKALESGKADQAVEQFSTAVAQGATSAQTYGGLGAALIQQGRLEEAIASLTKATELDPKDDIFLENLSIARTELFKRNGDASLLVGAVQAADEAARLRPDRIGPIFARAEAYYLGREYEKALTDLQECVKRSDRFKRAWLLKGMTNASLGRVDAAKTDFNKVIQLDPNDDMASQARAELAKLP